MPSWLDKDRLRRELVSALAAMGSASGTELSRRLGISQPTFSRLLRDLGGEILRTGRARSVRYAATREVPDVGRRIPIYEIDEAGGSRRAGVLHAIRPNGFFVESLAADVHGGFFGDLPYFLDHLWPSGFLGRMIPRRHADLGSPADITHWTANHVLQYATRHGWNLPGNLVVGDQAFGLTLQHRRSPAPAVPEGERSVRYADFADDVLAAGPPGSSAAGEQPKFTAWRSPGPVEVLVKFSPPVDNPVAQRIADLLVVEHLAHQIVRAHGHEAPLSEIVEGRGRVFLEVERFDRTRQGGRRGVLSLLALDAEFVGRLLSWTDTAEHLLQKGLIGPEIRGEIAWRELFGHLTANTDMHPANISFHTRGTRLLGLAPIYDMLPMAYAPQQAQLRSVVFLPPSPDATQGGIWESAHATALGLWRTVAAHPRISDGFRAIAATNADALESIGGLGSLLPRPPPGTY